VPNLFGQAISYNDDDAAAKLMQDALGVENNNVVELLLSENLHREQRASNHRPTERRRVIWSKSRRSFLFPKAYAALSYGLPRREGRSTMDGA